MKVTNVLKVGLVLMVGLFSVGCVSTVGMGAKQSTTKMPEGGWTEHAYGIVSPAINEDSKKFVCLGVQDEPRCKDEKYFPVLMAVSFGYADAARGLWALATKDELEKVFTKSWQCSARNESKCYFGKFIIKNSGLADFGGIVSEPDQKGPCTWKGLPGHGGTVCESLGFDYRKAKLPLVRNF